MSEAREIDISEHSEVPLLSVVLGYGPMVPLVVGAAGAWVLAGTLRNEVVLLTARWATTILAFLSGVRRGLSFRTEGGPRLTQIVTMLGLFTLAFVAFILIAHGFTVAAVACVLVGYASIIVLNPIAARHGEAPLFFERLRPPQMTIAVFSLAVLLANLWHHS